MNGSAGTVDLPASPARGIGIAALGVGFVAVAGGYLVLVQPAGGSLATFVMSGGIVFGAVGIVAGAREALRRGPVVTVDPAGIHDRRLSTAPIPWTAIRSISDVAIRNQNFLVLETDPGQDASLPITGWARRLASMNAGLGIRGYAVAATALRGGFPALVAAVRAAAPVSLLGDLPA